MKDNDLFQQYLDLAHVMFIALDVAGNVIQVNRYAATLLGYDEHDMIGINWFENFLPKKEREKVQAVWNQLIAGNVQVVEYYENPVVTRSGEERVIAWHNSAIYNEQGQFISHVSSGTDITEKVEAERRLISSERRLSQAQAAGHIGVWDWKPASGELIWSDEVFHMLGFEVGEVDPSYELFLECVHPDDRDELNSQVEAALIEHKSYNIDCRILQKDAPDRIANAQGMVYYDELGNPVQMLGTIQDISERKRSEEKIHLLEMQFHQAQKMEALGTLVGGIAHDFNNTLAGITGNVFLAREGFPDSPPALLENLDVIDTLSFRAAKMIGQLLAFARKSTTVMKPISVASFIREVIELYAVSLPENISLLHEINISDLRIKGDSSLLQQMLINLLNNARDAVQGVDAPQINISVRAFMPDKTFLEKHPDATKQEFVRICVSDNGCGIARESMAHLFEPFFTTKEVGEGTGLGLAMVYGAIKTHHGFVDVESSESGGSNFCLYLPLLKDDEVAADHLELTAGVVSGHGETILVVDDESIVVDIAARILKRLDYQVFTASNGQEAVNMYQAQGSQIDLVMLDVVMPRMGGVDAAIAIRSINAVANIMFSTGYDHTNTLSNMDDLSSEIVINKPFNIVELSWKIRDALNR